MEENTTTKKQQTVKVTANRKRSEQMKRDAEEQPVPEQKRVRRSVTRQKASVTEEVTDSVNKLKPLTRSRLQKQKGR